MFCFIFESSLQKMKKSGKTQGLFLTFKRSRITQYSYDKSMNKTKVQEGAQNNSSTMIHQLNCLLMQTLNLQQEETYLPFSFLREAHISKISPVQNHKKQIERKTENPVPSPGSRALSEIQDRKMLIQTQKQEGTLREFGNRHVSIPLLGEEQEKIFIPTFYHQDIEIENKMSKFSKEKKNREQDKKVGDDFIRTKNLYITSKISETKDLKNTLMPMEENLSFKKSNFQGGKRSSQIPTSSLNPSEVETEDWSFIHLDNVKSKIQPARNRKMI